MAKGDKIEVMVATADGVRGFTVTASKAGRKVTQNTRVRRKVTWLDVEEVTRTNRVTGNLVQIPLAAVLAVQVFTLDVPDEPRPAATTRKRTAPTVPLGLDE